MIDDIDALIRRQLVAELDGMPVAAPSWRDVARRAGSPRRSQRRALTALAAAALLAALLVPAPGFGLVPRIYDLFASRPAPASLKLYLGMIRGPAIPGRAREVARVRTPLGSLLVWSAPGRGGLDCSGVQGSFAVGSVRLLQVGDTRVGNFGESCGTRVPSRYFGSHPPLSLATESLGPRLRVAWGRIEPRIARLDIVFEDGTHEQAGVGHGWAVYLYTASAFRRGHRPVAMLVYGRSGRRIAVAAIDPVGFIPYYRFPEVRLGAPGTRVIAAQRTPSGARAVLFMTAPGPTTCLGLQLGTRPFTLDCRDRPGPYQPRPFSPQMGVNVKHGGADAVVIVSSLGLARIRIDFRDGGVSFPVLHRVAIPYTDGIALYSGGRAIRRIVGLDANGGVAEQYLVPAARKP